ncbi:MAG: maleylpyruvate isomerase N-terminal domain-containing protein [Saprospiraceae bacterium]|nr:maleylpyruvate isomerase N-terminal domain-containing protein [Saprospiraceae bacterium]
MNPPIPTVHLFPILDELLLSLLRSFSASDWERPTPAPRWKVKDVAAHLLDGNLRTLSMLRDGHFGESPENVQSYEDLVGFLNRLNADWVAAMKRLSPALLIELLDWSGRQYSDYLQSLDPFAKAVFPVAWAGEAQSENWFHIAREYTEKWHHQQQIRFATGQEQVLYRRELYFPYLDTSMRALPHHYHNVPAETGTVIQFSVSGEGGGHWFLQRSEDAWHLVQVAHATPVCTVEIEGEIAWRIFTKGISREEAGRRCTIAGRRELGERVLEMLAVMA